MVLLAVTAAYFAAGRLGLSLAVVHRSASAVWPPTGIAVASCLIFGAGVWPAIFAGAFLVNVTTSPSAAASLGIAVGNTLEGLIGAWLVARFAGGKLALASVQGVFGLAGLAAIATMISATVGVASLSAAGLVTPGQHGSVWLTWWLGDAAGAIVFAPLLLLWAAPQRGDALRRRPFEAAALLGTLGITALVVFGLPWPLAGAHYALEFLCVPVLLWAAFRFGPRETATACVALSGLAIWGTMRGLGPFGRAGPNEALLLLQAFMGVVTVALLAVAVEVAQRRETEAQVRLLNRLKDEFLATLSHELRTPLNAILGWAHMLLHGQVADHSRMRALQTIYRNACVQQQLVDDILDIARITTGTLHIERHPVDVAALVESALESVRLSARSKEICLEAIVDPSVGALVGDAKRLVQVLCNLLDNAIKFSPAGRRVRLRAARCASGVTLAVEDEGPGIAPEFLPHVFERFRQADSSFTREHGGLGLGLSIVRHIVEVHGGSATVANRAEGGAVFSVTLPAPPAASEPGPARRMTVP